MATLRHRVVNRDTIPFPPATVAAQEETMDGCTTACAAMSDPAHPA